MRKHEKLLLLIGRIIAISALPFLWKFNFIVAWSLLGLAFIFTWVIPTYIDGQEKP